MDYLIILAQTTAEKGAETEQAAQIVPIDLIWEQITALTWLQAVIAISFGVVYLLYGWRIFKILTIISFALLGLRVGMLAGGQFDNEVWGGVIGLVVLAALSVPLIRWAVSILGAVAGGVITAGVWYACQLPEEYIWAGAIIGIIAGGMISFIIFKISVMLFTSLGGSVLIVIGALALMYHYEISLAEPTAQLNGLVHEENWFLPVLLMVPTAIGIIIQNNLIKGSPKWEL